MNNYDYTIRWQKELDLYTHLSSSIILEGNINDLHPFENNNQFEITDLDDYLHKYLQSIGYRLIVFFNHVDGLYFKEGVEKKNKILMSDFNKIISDTVLENEIDKNPIAGNEVRRSKFEQVTVLIRKAMANKKEPIAIVLNHASRYVTSSSNLMMSEQYLYSELFLSTKVREENKKSSQLEIQTGNENYLGNLLILTADKLNDIPTWYYLNNPLVKTISIPFPDRDIRKKIIKNNFQNFYGAHEVDIIDQEKIQNLIVDLTDGFRGLDFSALEDLTNKQKISVAKIEDAITLLKHGEKDNPWSHPDLLKKLPEIYNSLKERVKGQDACIQASVDIITRAIFGLSGIQHSSSRAKPKGILFFAGPSGTGKTELAKSLAEWLFGSEDFCIRFDMSEFSQSHSDQRLLGAPPGYVGYETGGELTNAVKQKPFSVLLFDEIEKAHPTILDKFLQILEDGRMTDGRGETVHFSDTLIIFTSNMGMKTIVTEEMVNPITGQKSVYERKIDTVKYGDEKDYETYRKKFMDAIDYEFKEVIHRPEIKNRIGENFIIFKYIGDEAGKAIMDSQLKKIKNNLMKEKKLQLEISENAYQNLFNQISLNLKDGGRGVGNQIEKHLINPLSRYISSNIITNNYKIIINDIIVGAETTEIICEHMKL